MPTYDGPTPDRNFMIGHFTFDAPTGTYKNRSLTSTLTERSRSVGPIFPVFCCFEFGALDDLLDLEDSCTRILTYQRRWLEQALPGDQPELRIGLPTNFGRTKIIAWYSPRIDKTFLEESRNTPSCMNPVVLL